MRWRFLTGLLLACTQPAPRSATVPPAPRHVAAVAVAAPAPAPQTPPSPAAPVDPPIPPELLSPPLRNAALRSPMPGGYVGGWYGDTGVDIAGRYLPVYALADGVLEYSEHGHTLWTGKGDTANSIRIRLDAPIPFHGHRVTHVYYTHLSALVTEQPESSRTKKHVVAGERIATSGIGNGVPHLHLGLLLDDQVEQDSWDYILREDAIRKVMGGYRNGERLEPGASLLRSRTFAGGSG
jgi:murein DD-endopeptidase MepM/ murein hydrolase activator NlpD